MAVGYIHSFESMGLVDGPGIRSVVFLQGCCLRCAFCHNPDTWGLTGGTPTEPEALVRKLSRFRSYYQKSGGGVTFSGGELLMQPDFLLDCLRLCREADIHTCIDTAGVGRGDYTDILKYTDLVLYDVKHHDPAAYEALTGRPMDQTLRFVEAVRQSGTPMWVRHVVVPGRTDSADHLRALRAYVDMLPNVHKVELLPYHKLGENKYNVLGIPYPLTGTPPMDKARCASLQQEFFGDLGGE